MALPGISIQYRKGQAVQNDNDTACLPLVIGCSSAGPYGVTTLLSGPQDLTQFGVGAGVELAAEVGAEAGWPVLFRRVPITTSSVIGGVVKAPKNIVATSLFGALLMAGATSPNGDVVVTALQAGVQIELANDGASKTLQTTVSGKSIRVRLATDAGSAVTTNATQLETELNTNAAALVVATKQGTGAGAAAVLAPTTIANGDVSYLPRQPGVTVTHVVAGAGTVLSVGVVGKTITVNIATNADSEPTSTAAQVVAKLQDTGAAMLLVAPTASGTGAGLAGKWAATSISYGSTGAMVLSGPPVDRFDVQVRVLRGGTIGGAGIISIQWSLDAGNSWSSEAIVPTTGIVVLQDTRLISGITATFTGVLDAGDLFYAVSTQPEAALADVLTQVDQACQNTTYKFGMVVGHTPLSRSQAGQLDTVLQQYKQTRFVTGLFPIRDQNATEIESDWRTAVQLDFQGFVSQIGLVRLVAGWFEHSSSYTLRQYHRPWVYAVAARRAAISVHESCGYTGRGPVPAVGNAPPGYVQLNGADANGGVFYRALVPGVSVQHVAASGNNKPLAVLGGPVITVILGTDGGGLVNSTAAQVAAAVNAVAPFLVTATATGTGASVAGTQAQPVQIVGNPISHDERLQQGLDSARFITSRTYDESPGSYWITASPTMADSSEGGYTTMQTSDVMLSVGRVAKAAAFPYIEDTPATIPFAESDVVPKGAIELTAGADIEVNIGGQVEAFLFRPKKDGRASAGAYPANVPACQVLRNYSLKDTNELRLVASANLLGEIRTITIAVQPQ